MDNTKIEWTDATWNFLRGCSRVSEGCRNCYAESIAGRFSGVDKDGKKLPYNGLATMVNGEARWTGEISFHEDILLQPLRWTRPRKIFVNSMSDLFHEKVTDEMLDKAFAVMALTPQHTYQILTKRPERMKAYFENRDGEIFNTATARIMVQVFNVLSQTSQPLKNWESLLNAGRFVQMEPQVYWFRTWPLPNVWLGVSVEDQKTADERIPHLLNTPAAVRFLSMEPLLGRVDIRHYLYTRYHHGGTHHEYNQVEWVIVGGESGPQARPVHPNWVRDIRNQCELAEVPFFFKQWGEWTTRGEAALKGYEKTENTIVDGPEFPTIMSKIGKKAAGRLLDGREWNEFPEVSR